MSKKGRSQQTENTSNEAGDEKVKRSRCDYTFQIHNKDGSKEDLGLTLHSPTDAGLFVRWYQKKLADEGIDAEVVTGVFRRANV